jgi:hypothetical protein
MMNTNCLQGLRCPECGAYEPFAIEVQALALIYDAGTESGDMRRVLWDDTSWCACFDCDWTGTVADFRVGHVIWSTVTVCALCESETPMSRAHLHQGRWIGACCWDERLRATE